MEIPELTMLAITVGALALKFTLFTYGVVRVLRREAQRSTQDRVQNREMLSILYPAGGMLSPIAARGRRL